MKTVTILIGNSDDKLGQAIWASFCDAVDTELRELQARIWFSGYSIPNKPWQNACWVIGTTKLEKLKMELSRLARLYLQNEIAILVGDTEMVKP